MDGELTIILMNILLNFGIGLIVTLSLNLEVGYMNLPQFGRMLAVLVGATVAGGVSGRIIAALLGFPFGAEYAGPDNYRIVNDINMILEKNPVLSILYLILTLVLAAILGGVMGYLTAYPAIRLREAYLGITLLAFADILQNIVWYYDPIAGGTQGINVVDPFRFFGPKRFEASIYVIVAIALLVFIYIELLTRSPYGRVLRAIRDAETAAAVYGKNIVQMRSYTMIIGGAIAAVAGALWALYTGSFKAITYTRLLWTFWPWAYMMLGGTGNNLGVLVGVLIFSIFRTYITIYKHEISSYLMISAEWLEYILVGLVIVLIVLIRPQGLIPEKPTHIIPRREIEKIISSQEQGSSGKR
ncbi:MAG: branched-chain amino acid ABC transporter permease [Sulfolobales archaeon]